MAECGCELTSINAGGERIITRKECDACLASACSCTWWDTHYIQCSRCEETGFDLPDLEDMTTSVKPDRLLILRIMARLLSSMPDSNREKMVSFLSNCEDLDFLCQ